MSWFSDVFYLFIYFILFIYLFIIFFRLLVLLHESLSGLGFVVAWFTNKRLKRRYSFSFQLVGGGHCAVQVYGMRRKRTK